MKLSAVHKLDFSADYWPYIIQQDPITGEQMKFHTFDEGIKCVLLPLSTGTLSIFCEMSLQHNSILRNLTDSAGQLVYANSLGQSVDAYVGVGEPVFNVYGQVYGYRHDLFKAGE